MEHYDIDAITDAVMFELEVTGGYFQDAKDAAARAANRVKDAAKDGAHKTAVIMKKRTLLSDIQTLLRKQNENLNKWKPEWPSIHEKLWDDFHNRNHAMVASTKDGTVKNTMQINIDKQLHALDDVIYGSDLEFNTKITTLKKECNSMQDKWKEYITTV
jgi:hypothetical protein